MQRLKSFPALPQASGSGSKSKKKEAEKVPEIDENLWKQTQMTVTNWADCDDDDDFDTLAPPPADWVRGGERSILCALAAVPPVIERY